MERSIVVCELPRTGLGNQLFPLMKALVFSELHDLPVIVTGYHSLKLGPYLRGEKSKRKYSNYFSFQKNRVGEMVDRFKIRRLKRKLPIISNPDPGQCDSSRVVVYIFTAAIKHNNYFEGLRQHRSLVRDIFCRILDEKIKRQLQFSTTPSVGVHIRMGDFKKLAEGQKFRSVGGVRTPKEYFIDIIQGIRKGSGVTVPVSVFSDGYRSELMEILSLPKVELIEGNADIVDLVLLSKSSIIVASAGSTFSYWAGFLSDAPLILHPDHIHEPIREPNGGLLYEGPLDADSNLLASRIFEVVRQ